jgi:FRG domain
MPWTELYPQTLDDLYLVLNKIADTQVYVFRGHACATWTHLVPSIHRILGSGTLGEQIVLEAAAIRAFRRHGRSLLHVSELDYLRRILDSITLMQHYGAPTRLLDWTLSPWVACYFAVQDHHEEDASIWTFNRDELDKRNHTHRKSRSSDFARFAELASASTVEDWAWSAMRAGPYIGTFRYEFANPQMGAQQSLFTISGQLGDDHDIALARSLPESWQTLRVIVSKSHKEALRRRLFRMNVGALNLFPSIDGVGRHIRDALQSRFPLGDEGLLWNLQARARKKEKT